MKFLLKKPFVGIRKGGILLPFFLTLLLGTSIVSFAGTSVQAVDLEYENVALEKALRGIAKKSDMKIFFRNADLEKAGKITLRGDMSLEKALKSALKNTGLSFKIDGKQIIIFGEAKSTEKQVQEQKIRVSGIVKDAETGEGLIGVNVIEKGETSNGTITDFSGNFLIIVDKDATLTFTSIGFEPLEVNVNGRTNIELTMSPSMEQLEDVVVTAFGVKKEKKKVGYSVTELKGSSISDVQVVNPVDGLQGKVAGVQITQGAGGSFGGTRITIRGNSTLNQNTQPMFVVDGIIIENGTSGGDQWGVSDWGNDLKNLNPDEFESVTVLKGAAAAALYGSRALEGVVIITSKKGKKRNGIGLDVKHSSGFTEVYDGPDFQNEYGGGFIAGYSGHEDGRDTRQFLTNSDGEPIRDTGAPSWGPKMEGQKIREYDGSWGTYSPQPDNFKDIYEIGRTHNTSVSLSGGSDNNDLSYRASYSNMFQKGVDPGNDFERNSLQISLNKKISERLSTDVLANYTKSIAKNPPQRSLQRSFIYDVFPRDYDPNKWKDDYKAPHGGLPNGNNGDISKGPGGSLYWKLFEENRERTEETLRLKVGLQYTITDWLNWAAEGYINNLYTTYEEKNLGSGINNSGGFYKVENRRREQLFGKTTLNFNKDFNEDWNVAFSVGGETWETSGRNSRAQTDGGLIVPGNYTISNSKNNPKTGGGQESTRKLISAYFFGDIAWKNMLFLTVTGRNDWNSTMAYPDGSGNYSFFYPSTSLAWAFSESFELPSFVTFGKLRASYAEVGNGTSAYLLSDGYKKTGDLEGVGPRYSYKSNKVYASDFKPERSKAFEVGADLRFLDNRLGIDFTWFKKNTYDQILGLGVPSYSGVGSMVFNAGNIQNQGIELAINATPLKIGDFKWEIDMNYTRLRNEIVDLDEDLGITEKGLHGNATYGDRIGSYAIVGGNYGDLMTDAAYKRDANGNIVVKWHGGARSPYPVRNGERKTVGNIMTDWYGGVTNTFSYKGLSMRVFLDVKMGGDIYSFTQRYGMQNGLFESSLANRDREHGGIVWTSSNGKEYEDGVVPKGMVFDEGTTINDVDVSGMTVEQAYKDGVIEPIHVSALNYFPGSWSRGIVEEFVNEASYVALREIVVSYSVPREITKKFHLRDVRLSLYGRNLGFLYNSLPDNINPEANASSRAADAFEYGATPYVRNYGFTIGLGL
ncbi:SusC/RagA family TonB-linked outer membrane protein (plasmid) [Fulvitalea axinellae]|uniref:SusC/RagA family TonB-linked outer membrane protein n=1 Tax=Fulvitalea axinellae TaxID=1182444 RepID=A0AAU9CTP9_9BACT|nr:SusC/RagA family TonB-linked outer membrane protein [Fulvitalea axinellae]